MTRLAGATHPNAKLTEADVAWIRASGLTVTELAVRFNMSKATISLIRRGKLWVSQPSDEKAPKVNQVKLSEVTSTNMHHSDIFSDIDQNHVRSDVCDSGVIDLNENDVIIRENFEDQKSTYIKPDIYSDMDTLGNVRMSGFLKDTLRNGAEKGVEVIRKTTAFPSGEDDEDGPYFDD